MPSALEDMARKLEACSDSASTLAVLDSLLSLDVEGKDIICSTVGSTVGKLSTSTTLSVQLKAEDVLSKWRRLAELPGAGLAWTPGSGYSSSGSWSAENKEDSEDKEDDTPPMKTKRAQKRKRSCVKSTTSRKRQRKDYSRSGCAKARVPRARAPAPPPRQAKILSTRDGEYLVQFPDDEDAEWVSEDAVDHELVERYLRQSPGVTAAGVRRKQRPPAQEKDAEYVVEKILDETVKEGAKMFLIKWEGYGDDANTWEPQQSLISCDSLVKEFRLAKSKRQRKQMEPPDSSKMKERDVTLVRTTKIAAAEGFYEVEKIIEMRHTSTEPAYLIKWLGCDDLSWEPSSNLDCAALIADFKAKSREKIRRPCVLSEQALLEEEEEEDWDGPSHADEYDMETNGTSTAFVDALLGPGSSRT